ncbi:store-operated calcium entry regulator STIMATE-like [Sinocyclocheilus rhinocerous]|uniref:store-operated calcium entry regulator STIMATE-like n=1 Tax=Sinocyclocheilus rhinocerous TaxID=307959 RepID=UPI0007B8B726|nr:PREDICTED: store-operated calcium entry regulator STIMATE-like [Sinocyclocheilus rhinocerous]
MVPALPRSVVLILVISAPGTSGPEGPKPGGLYFSGLEVSKPGCPCSGGPRGATFVISASFDDYCHLAPHEFQKFFLMEPLSCLLQLYEQCCWATLGNVAINSQLVKRFREPVGIRRPWRIWFFDTSKQAVGALFMHFANVFLSTLTNEDPCSLYLLNFLLDATLGMLVIWAGVKVVSKIVEHKQLTLLMFGEYGDPPRIAAWLAQCSVYLLIVALEKSVVTLVLLVPGWTNLEEVVLDYIPNPQLELAIVMLIVPFIVNSIMFWVVDSLTMRKYKKMTSLEGSRDCPKQVEVLPNDSNDEAEVLLKEDEDDATVCSEQEEHVSTEEVLIRVCMKV